MLYTYEVGARQTWNLKQIRSMGCRPKSQARKCLSLGLASNEHKHRVRKKNATLNQSKCRN